MKKPKVEYIHYEPFAVIQADGEWLSSKRTCEAYSEMIDALIEVEDFIQQTRHQGYTDEQEYREIAGKIEQSLRKAGVQI